MVSRNDFAIGILVLIAGIVIYSFAPGGAMYMPMPGHTTTHYVGGALAIVFGLIGLALYKKTNMITAAVSVLSIILGIVFILDAPRAARSLWRYQRWTMVCTCRLPAASSHWLASSELPAQH